MLAADILGVVASRLDDYSDIAGFCKISDAHGNIARRTVTSIRNGQLPAKDICMFTRLETINGPLIARSLNEAADFVRPGRRSRP